MRVTRMQLDEGSEIPAWYGIAYLDFCSGTAICYPMPFNWLARWFRAIKQMLRKPALRHQEELLELKKAEARGFEKGVSYVLRKLHEWNAE